MKALRQLFAVALVGVLAACATQTEEQKDTQRTTLEQHARATLTELYGMNNTAQTLSADAEALIERITTMVAANDAVQWAMTVKGDDTFIGLIGFWRMEKEHHLAELGYMLAHAHWGKGLMSEAIATVMDFGFGTLGCYATGEKGKPMGETIDGALCKALPSIFPHIGVSCNGVAGVSAVGAGFRAEVYYPIGAFDHVGIVLDH